MGLYMKFMWGERKQKVVLAVAGIVALLLMLAYFLVQAKYTHTEKVEVSISFREFRIAETEIMLSREEILPEPLDVTITASQIGDYDLKIQYKVDDGDWGDYLEAFTVNKNCTVSARIYRLDFTGPTTVKNITNILPVKIGDMRIRNLSICF
ncbi:MAG: hypothetical protein LBL91_04175 [Lachnospiraceae bacterium]|jgi:hypothetical protein|nr:hypothetical protein [Lachnospiraceae bacterium]